MAQNLLKQEEAQRLEKEKMKKLTLEINERQEEEDLNEAIAMVCCACAVGMLKISHAIVRHNLGSTLPLKCIRTQKIRKFGCA